MNNMFKVFTGLMILLSNLPVYSMFQESKKPHGNKVAPIDFSFVLPKDNNARPKSGFVRRVSPSTDIKEVDEEAERFLDFYQSIFNGEAKEVSTLLAEHKYPLPEDIKRLTAAAKDYALPDSEVWYALKDGKSPFWFAVSLILRNKGYGTRKDMMDVIQVFLSSEHSEHIDVNEIRFMDLASGGNAKNRCQCMLLHMATQLRDHEIMKLLIDQKADVNAGDEGGKRPLQYAAENSDYEARSILTDIGKAATHQRQPVKVSAVFELCDLVGLYQAVLDCNGEQLGKLLTQYGYPDSNIDTQKVAREALRLNPDIKMALEQERSLLWFAHYAQRSKKWKPDHQLEEAIFGYLLQCDLARNQEAILSYFDLYTYIFDGNFEYVQNFLERHGYPRDIDTKTFTNFADEKTFPDMKFALEQGRSPFWFAIYVRLHHKKKNPQQLAIIQELLKCNPEINEVGKFGPKENPVTIFCKALENQEKDQELFDIINSIKGRNKVVRGSCKSSQPDGGCCVVM